MSRPFVIGTVVVVRFTTTTFSIDGHSVTASSLIAFSGIDFVPRNPSFAVIKSLQPQSLIRSRKASAENQAKTTVWMAPILVHASIVMAASGIIGR